MSILNSATSFLFQVGRTLPDTVLTRQVATDMSFFDKVSAVGGAVLAIGVLVLAIGVLVAAWNFGKAVKGFLDFLGDMRVDLAPAIRSVTAVSEDVQDITKRAREQVKKVDEKVDKAHAVVDNALDKANAFVDNTVKKTDSQVQRFQSFLGLVQDKIESGFVSAASTVRGVQTGIDRMVDVAKNNLKDNPRRKYTGLKDELEDDLDDYLEDDLEDDTDDLDFPYDTDGQFTDEELYDPDAESESAQRKKPRVKSRTEKKHE